MQIYLSDNKFLTGEDVIDHEKIHYGESYILTGGVEHINFNQNPTTTIEEVVNENGMVFVTDNKGDQPFAAFTNDSHRDNFRDDTVLSKIVLKEGFFVVLSFYNNLQPSPTYIFEVKNNKVKFKNRDAVGVQCVYKGNTLKPIDKFDKATEHIVKVMRQIGLPAQLQDKYCFQTTRKVLLCYMSKDERGEMSSSRDKKMVLNNNSQARYDKQGIPIEEGFYRVFYSRRFKDSTEVFVEGVHISNDYLKFDIHEFIEKADTDVRPNIRIVTTKNGLKFYATINNRGELRPIIKLGHFTSFPLSEKEIVDNVFSIEAFKTADVD